MKPNLVALSMNTAAAVARIADLKTVNDAFSCEGNWARLDLTRATPEVLRTFAQWACKDAKQVSLASSEDGTDFRPQLLDSETLAALAEGGASRTSPQATLIFHMTCLAVQSMQQPYASDCPAGACSTH